MINHLILLENANNDGYQHGLASMVYKLFDKNSRDATHTGTGIVSDAVSENQQFARELHKRIIRKIKKHKAYSSFRDKIWGADLADMQLTRKYNKDIQFL